MASQTMEFAAPSTPTAGERIHTPDAPQFGCYSDEYIPFTPRKSSRIAQRNANITPPPKVSRKSHIDKSHELHSLGSPKRHLSKLTVSCDMDEPELVPAKKRMPAMTSASRRVSGTLTASSTATAAAALGLSGNPESLSVAPHPAIATTAGMLITPVKTPQKAPTPKTKAKVSMVARNLFRTDEDSMPARKSQTGGYVLDSMFQDDDEPIEIYTDSHERIPEVDRSKANPFYLDEQTAPAAPSPKAPRRSERKTAKKGSEMISIPGEGKITIEEAVKRTDGMVIIFRGKRQFRKFLDEEAPEGGLESNVESPTRNTFTRASIKPRLLFPEAKANVPEVKVDVPEVKVTDEDEEADTDIEDHVVSSMEDKKESASPAAPMVLSTPDTPKAKDPAPRGMPNSPPPTKRTTRFRTKSASPSKAAKAKEGSPKKSPFDGWHRTKTQAELEAESESSRAKRAGSPMPGKSSKRNRV